MLKFRGQGKKGRVVLGFMLEKENLERLIDGQPIAFPLEDFGFEGVDILIGAGKKEEFIEAFKKAGIKIDAKEGNK